MAQHTVSQTIKAPSDRVFGVVAGIEAYPEVFPSVTKVDFISDQRSGVGTRFSETRLGSGRDGTSEVEVVEYAQGDHIRLQDDHLGSTWDTTYTVQDQDGSTQLTLAVQAEPRKLMAKLTMALGMSGYRKNMEKHVAAIKAHCETLT